jgi:DNA-binding HxlR family transcriptional regulator
MSKVYTPVTAARDVEQALNKLEGRWKLVILFHLFDGQVRRFSELERAIPGISQKMLGQQLRQLEADGLVVRTVFPEIPPKVEYALTAWGQDLCPVLDAMLRWSAARPLKDVEDQCQSLPHRDTDRAAATPPPNASRTRG